VKENVHRRNTFNCFLEAYMFLFVYDKQKVMKKQCSFCCYTLQICIYSQNAEIKSDSLCSFSLFLVSIFSFENHFYVCIMYIQYNEEMTLHHTSIRTKNLTTSIFYDNRVIKNGMFPSFLRTNIARQYINKH
jgi:hypothetical protein